MTQSKGDFMKRMIVATDTVEAMSKLTKKYADKSLFDEDFGEFIYFSPVLDSHGPRIKFYGGSVETNTTRTAPSLSFGVDGVNGVILQDWMNKKNCPNGFDDDYIESLTRMVNRIRPILLLVWFNKLDESEALHYFEGSNTWEDLLQEIQVDDSLKSELKACKNMKQLHQFCVNYQMYEF